MTETRHTIMEIDKHGTRVFKTILKWLHDNGEAHCLARVFEPLDDKPIVVISEIRSNPDHRDIGSEPAKVAEALLRLSELAGTLSPTSTLWLLHHGDFSYYDGGGEDTFTRLTMIWDGDHFYSSLDSYELLESSTVRELVGPLSLESVPQVLQQLDWNY
ncbi:MAG: hypothetical protein JWN52_4475 [Actinomycetia bacterium]|nr:hypothetical protein [Actinomycetes bacterium]